MHDEHVRRQGALEQLQMRVNPIFTTAEMTLYQLALLGNADAQSIVRALGLTYDKTQMSATHAMSAAQELCFSIVVATRYATMERLATSHACQVVDLPCGFTPRAVDFARQGRRYVGLDLPAVVEKMSKIAPGLVDEDKRGLIRYAAVDATNYASLDAALSGIDEEICVTCEGLLMYLTDAELDAVLDNIHHLISSRGGHLITADPEIAVQHMHTLRAIGEEHIDEAAGSSTEVLQEKADAGDAENSLTVRVGHEAQDINRVIKTFKDHGFASERICLSEIMDTSLIAGLDRLNAKQKASFIEEMKACSYWKLTCDATPKRQIAKDPSGFSMRSSYTDDTLSVELSGRLDTLSSPDLLELFEDVLRKVSVKRVEIECRDLAYISSAGIRTLVIMRKKCTDGVALFNASAQVRESICLTGIDQIISINGA